MGVVYRCRDPRLARTVALKLLRLDDEDRRDEELRERFAREARAAGSLEHPNIVTIFDVGEDDGQPFIVMELIEGVTLAQQIRDTPPLSLDRKLQVIEDLAAALDYAHEQDIVHRDIKPANLMLTHRGGVLKILDFGIARLGGSSHTRLGVMVGSPNYMSPEQATGRPADARSDIFSVGLVLYELLSGRRAFSADNGLLAAILFQTPAPLTDLCPDIDPALVAIVDRAIAKEPSERYQTAREMSDEVGSLRRMLSSRAGSADESTVFMRPPPHEVQTPTPRAGTNPELLKRRANTIDGHIQTARQALQAQDYAAAIDACEQAQLLDPDEPRALALLEKATGERDALLIRGWLDEARRCIERLDFEQAAQLVDRALEIAPASPDAQTLRRTITRIRRDEQQRQQAAGAALESARASLADGHFETAIRTASEVLSDYPTHAEAHELTRRALDLIQERRDREERERAALEAIDRQQREFAAGRRSEAIAALEQFTPPHDDVSAVLADLRREHAAIEQREREEQERRRIEQADTDRRHQAQQRWVARQLEQARQTIAARQFVDAIEALEHVERIDPNAPGLAALLEEARAAEAALRLQQQITDDLARIADDVKNGRLPDALALVESVLTRAPDHAVARELRDQVRSAIEARRQETIAREAAAAIEAANRRFDAGEHTAAVAMLEAFTSPHASIARARDELAAKLAEIERQREVEQRERADAARGALERARRAIAHYEFEAALRALDETAVFDPDSPEIPALRTRAIAGLEDARRRAEHDRRAAEAIAASRGRFDGGDTAGALQELEDFSPAHELVWAALLQLREELAERERVQREAEERQRRAEALTSACQRGVAALNDGDITTADGLADEALAIDPTSADANDLKARAVAALDERARRADHERRAREALAAAHQLLASGHPADGLALLERFDPPHPVVSDALPEVRAAVAVIQEQQQREAEEGRQHAEAQRLARDQRIEKACRQARDEISTGHFAEALDRLQQLRDAEGDVIGLDGLIEYARFTKATADAAAHQASIEAKRKTGAHVTPRMQDSANVLRGPVATDDIPHTAPRTSPSRAEASIRLRPTTRSPFWIVVGVLAAALVLVAGLFSVFTPVGSPPPVASLLASRSIPLGTVTIPSGSERRLSGISAGSDPVPGGGETAVGGAATTPGGGRGTGSGVGGIATAVVGGPPGIGGRANAGGATGASGATGAGGGTTASGGASVGGGTTAGGGTSVGGGTSGGGGGTLAGGATGAGGGTTAGATGIGGGTNAGGVTSIGGTTAGAATITGGPTGAGGGTSAVGGTGVGRAAGVGGGASVSGGESAAIVDRREIEEVVERYRLAYNKKDLNSIKEVYPRATNELTFRNALKGCSLVDLSFTSKRTDLLSDGTAQVETRSIYGCTPGTRQPRVASPPVVDTFRLERSGGSWVITDLLVPRGR
jgi:hypothetical protein